MGPDDGRAVVEQYWEAMQGADFDGLKGLFADVVVVEWPMFPAPDWRMEYVERA